MSSNRGLGKRVAADADAPAAFRKASWTLTNRGRTATGHGGIGDPPGTERAATFEGRFSFKLRIDKVYKQIERISLGVCLATLTPHSGDDHTDAVEGSTSLAACGSREARGAAVWLGEAREADGRRAAKGGGWLR